MGLSPNGLRQLLSSGVAEIKFVRRHNSPGRPGTRRMLASLNRAILDTENGRSILNFKPPVYPAAYNANNYNLVIVFDLFMQDWRAIPADTVEIIKMLPSNSPEEFWKYFNEVLIKMSASQKADFMDK